MDGLRLRWDVYMKAVDWLSAVDLLLSEDSRLVRDYGTWPSGMVRVVAFLRVVAGTISGVPFIQIQYGTLARRWLELHTLSCITDAFGNIVVLISLYQDFYQSGQITNHIAQFAHGMQGDEPLKSRGQRTQGRIPAPKHM
jgi:hypothetical protein